MRDAYAAHEALVAPARRHAEFWRLLAGAGVVALLTVGLGILYRTGLEALFQVVPALRVDLTRSDTAPTLLLMLFSFGLVIVAVVVAARTIHGRDPLSLVGPLPLALRQFGRVVGVLLLVHLALMLLPPYGGGGETQVVSNLDPRLWLMLLPLSLGGILLQTGSEELLFRGYLQQTLAARFDARWIWMGVPAVLFGIGHYQPGVAGANAPVIVAWAICFGLAAADLTARAGTLGPALALHMINNTGALLFVSVKGEMSGLSLATLPHGLDEVEKLTPWLVLDFAFLLVGWLAARLAIRR